MPRTYCVRLTVGKKAQERDIFKDTKRKRTTRKTVWQSLWPVVGLCESESKGSFWTADVHARSSKCKDHVGNAQEENSKNNHTIKIDDILMPILQFPFSMTILCLGREAHVPRPLEPNALWTFIRSAALERIGPEATNDWKLLPPKVVNLEQNGQNGTIFCLDFKFSERPRTQIAVKTCKNKQHQKTSSLVWRNPSHNSTVPYLKQPSLAKAGWASYLDRGLENLSTSMTEVQYTVTASGIDAKARREWDFARLLVPCWRAQPPEIAVVLLAWATKASPSVRKCEFLSAWVLISTWVLKPVAPFDAMYRQLSGAGFPVLRYLKHIQAELLASKSWLGFQHQLCYANCLINITA